MKRNEYKPLAPEDEKILLRCLDTIWAWVGYDALQGDEKARMRRSVVIEIAIDQFLSGHKDSLISQKVVTKEKYEFFRNWLLTASNNLVTKTVKKGFKEQWYGI